MLGTEIEPKYSNIIYIHVVPNADAKMILMAAPPEDWRRPPGRPRITWLNTIQQDLRTHNFTLNNSRPGSEPSSVEVDVYVLYGAMHS